MHNNIFKISLVYAAAKFAGDAFEPGLRLRYNFIYVYTYIYILYIIHIYIP